MSEQTPRQRFIKAMKSALAGSANVTPRGLNLARRICEAFADAVCQSGGDAATCHLATEGGDHAACRAALLKECGL